MKPIATYKYVPEINAYLIQRPDGSIAGWIHTLIHNLFYADCFDEDGHIVYQNRSRIKDFATVLGSNGIDAKGYIIDGIPVYKQMVPSSPDDKNILIQFESKNYIPGLERLKAFGYKI